MAAKEFQRSSSRVLSNPSYGNLENLPGGQSEIFTVTNADNAGIYRVSTYWQGSGSVALVNSSGASVIAPQNGGDWQGAIAAGSYAFKILSGSPTHVSATIERLN